MIASLIGRQPESSDSVKALKPWEQYAQVLLLANEFLFVD